MSFVMFLLALLGIAAGYHLAFGLLITLTYLTVVVLALLFYQAEEIAVLIPMAGVVYSLCFFVPAWITDGIVRGWLLKLFKAGGALFK